MTITLWALGVVEDEIPPGSSSSSLLEQGVATRLWAEPGCDVGHVAKCPEEQTWLGNGGKMKMQMESAKSR